MPGEPLSADDEAFGLCPRSVLETDLRMEQEDKANLIGSLTEQEEKLEQMQGEVESIRNISQNYEKLRNEHEYLQKMSHEQEETLAELGSHLSEYVFAYFKRPIQSNTSLVAGRRLESRK